MALASFPTPFSLEALELCSLDWLLPNSLLTVDVSVSQTLRCQPYYLSPRGQFWRACSATASVAGRQQLDGGACASAQQSANSSGADLGSEQYLKHSWLCVHQPFQPGGSVCGQPFYYCIFMLIGGQGGFLVTSYKSGPVVLLLGS